MRVVDPREILKARPTQATGLFTQDEILQLVLEERLVATDARR
jgi:hypothetical protein